MKAITRKINLYKRSTNYQEYIKGNILLIGLVVIVLVYGYVNTLIIGG